MASSPLRRPPLATAARRLLTAAAAAAAMLGAGAAPAAAECPAKNPSYTSACGPTFVLPGWGDAGGWKDPEQYETIQLADVDGDGADELLGRTPTGLAIQDFDTTLGQWRPQVDDKNRPIVLTAFADPPPLSEANRPGSGNRWNTGGYPPKTDWTLPQYYDTIQAADIDGDQREEVLARGVDGLMVFKFTPIGDPKDGKGSWKQLKTSWQFRDSDHWGDHPSYYTTIGTGDLDGDGDAEVFARGSAGPTVLDWNGSSWRTVANITEILRDDHNGKDPAYYTSLQAADVTGDKREELIARDENGVAVYQFTRGNPWDVALLNPGLWGRAFADIERGPGAPDCPFVGDEGGQCLGSAPAYYGTLQFADVDGDTLDEALARSPAGLRGLLWDSAQARFSPHKTANLSDLGDRDFNSQDKWETVQSADIDGDGKAEVLARDKDGLNAWSYNPNPENSWTKLAPTTPLALADDPWSSDRSYYSTIQTGDVDGDGRDDVIARGPYGIRTWFYARKDAQGTVHPGWASYLPSGYPDFDTAEQQAAFAALNALARSHGYLTDAQDTIRDVWTGVTEPTADLKALMTNLASIAGCPASNDAFPQYESCKLPDGASGFTAADWTAVVNTIVAELYYATQVMDHFHSPVNGVREIWRDLLVNQLAQLPAITQQLKLQAAADIRAEYDTTELFSGIFGIAGTVVGLVPGVGEFAAAPLEITSEVMSMIPSASESLTDEFDSTINELQTAFASGVSEASQTMNDHSQIIRQDANLLTLVGQLRARGTWKLDPVGMESAGQQGFSLWLYKTLLPEMYVRYVVTNCHTRSVGDDCEQENTSRARLGEPGVAKGTDSASFSLIGYPPSQPSQGIQTPHPCWRPLFTVCHYDALPNDLAEKVWGPLADNCLYDGTTNSAAWRFGACSLGVDPLKSVQYSPIDNQNWDFPTYPGDFWVCSFCVQPLRPEVPARAAARGSARGFAGHGTTLRMRGTVRVPRAFRLRRARVTVARLLYERGGEGELADRRSGLPLRLSSRAPRRSRARTFVDRRKGLEVRLRLRRRSPRSLAFTLRASARRLDLPDACSGIRRGVDLADAPILLDTRLRIRDGRGRVHRIAFKRPWRCETNRHGAVDRLVLQRPQPLTPSRGGLAIKVRGPRLVPGGSLATYRIQVRNRRRTTAYDTVVTAYLPHGTRTARGARHSAVWHRAQLRAGQSKRMTLRVRIPRTAAGHARLRVAARAIDTRAVVRKKAMHFHGPAGRRAP